MISWNDVRLKLSRCDALMIATGRLRESWIFDRARDVMIAFHVNEHSIGFELMRPGGLGEPRFIQQASNTCALHIDQERFNQRVLLLARDGSDRLIDAARWIAIRSGVANIH